MGFQRCTFSQFIALIIMFTFASSYFCYDDHGHLLHNNFQEEMGFDKFGAYPSPFGFGFEDELQFSNSSEGGDGDSNRIFGVDGFGAVGDGVHDDTNAFQAAWKKACSSALPANFIVSPSKKYLLKPTRFLGPCKSSITVQIYGTIEASDKISDYSKDRLHWIVFDSIKNLAVEGGGTFNGKGKVWWQNSCKINKTLPCTRAPAAVTFFKCQNLFVQHLRFEDAQNVHCQFDQCINVQAFHLSVSSPEESPNTDGIHVKATQDIHISNCNIAAGDDCISIVSGSKNMVATNIVCGPGHGISIGSLGKGDGEAHVSEITVNGAIFSNTSNGVRIKTWQGGSGNVTNIKFQNVVMHDVKNPIIIDQYYCDKDKPDSCKEQPSAVQVSNVMYQNIRGTSAYAEAINIKCSKAVPCQGIILQNINLVREGGHAATATCENVKFKDVGFVTPHCP